MICSLFYIRNWLAKILHNIKTRVTFGNNYWIKCKLHSVIIKNIEFFHVLRKIKKKNSIISILELKINQNVRQGVKSACCKILTGGKILRIDIKSKLAVTWIKASVTFFSFFSHPSLKIKEYSNSQFMLIKSFHMEQNCWRRFYINAAAAGAISFDLMVAGGIYKGWCLHSGLLMCW